MQNVNCLRYVRHGFKVNWTIPNQEQYDPILRRDWVSGISNRNTTPNLLGEASIQRKISKLTKKDNM